MHIFESLSLKRLPRQTLLSAVAFGLLILAHEPSTACTIVVKADDSTILVGNNEDYLDPRTKVWFLPGTDQSHGRMIWGYDRHMYPYQGGMNEKGLFIDINAIGFTGWQDNPETPDIPGSPVDYILSHCATVDQAVAEFRKHDVDLGWVKYVVADENGSSAILEWLNDELHVIRRDRDYQISTNYLSPKEPTEPRYQISEQILKSQDRPAVDLIRKVLAATSYDVDLGQTMYSTICDLKRKKVYLYNFHFFEEVVTYDVAAELAKGNASYAIPALFEVSTHNEFWFNHLGSQLGARDLMKVIDEDGIEAATRKFHEMKVEQRTFNRYHFPEWMLQSMGLYYLSTDQAENAIGIFHLNTQHHPESWRAFSDLAEALAKNGDREHAIQNYQKALAINPESDALAETLNNLVDENQ